MDTQRRKYAVRTPRSYNSPSVGPFNYRSNGSSRTQGWDEMGWPVDHGHNCKRDANERRHHSNVSVIGAGNECTEWLSDSWMRQY